MAYDGDEHDDTEGGLVRLNEPGRLIQLSEHQPPLRGGLVDVADLDSIIKIERARAEIVHQRRLTEASIVILFMLIAIAAGMIIFGQGAIQTGGLVILTNLFSGVISYLYGVGRTGRRA